VKTAAAAIPFAGSERRDSHDVCAFRNSDDATIPGALQNSRFDPPPEQFLREHRKRRADGREYSTRI
jgi:hypothetical protein